MGYKILNYTIVLKCLNNYTIRKGLSVYIFEYKIPNHT